MSYRLRKRESLTTALRRIVAEELDAAIAELERVPAGHHEGIHGSRKHMKKVRSLIRLVKSRLDESGAAAQKMLRQTMQPLSGTRDAQAMVEAFESLSQTQRWDARQKQAFAPLRQALVDHRGLVHEDEAELEELSAAAIEQLRQVRAMSRSWEIRPRSFEALSKGIRKYHRAAVKGMRIAFEEKSPEAFHEWRKNVKHHWYHLRLLRGLWPNVMTAMAEELEELSDLLGDDHDLAVLRDLITHRPLAVEGDREAFVEQINDRQATLRDSCRALGQRLFAEKSKDLIRRLTAYWQVWHGQAKAEDVSRDSASRPDEQPEGV